MGGVDVECVEGRSASLEVARDVGQSASLEVARGVGQDEAPMSRGPPSILLKKNLKKP